MPFKQIKETLFNNRDIDLNSYKNQFIENNNYYEPNDFNDWIEQLFKIKLKRFLSKLEKSKLRYNDFVTIGVTEGKFTCSIISNDLFETIKKCVENAETIVIVQEKGYIRIEANFKYKGLFKYDIFMLNDKGVKFKTADLSKPCYHKSIREKII